MEIDKPNEGNKVSQTAKLEVSEEISVASAQEITIPSVQTVEVQDYCTQTNESYLKWLSNTEQKWIKETVDVRDVSSQTCNKSRCKRVKCNTHEDTEPTVDTKQTPFELSEEFKSNLTTTITEKTVTEQSQITGKGDTNIGHSDEGQKTLELQKETSIVSQHPRKIPALDPKAVPFFSISPVQQPLINGPEIYHSSDFEAFSSHNYEYASTSIAGSVTPQSEEGDYDTSDPYGDLEWSQEYVEELQRREERSELCVLYTRLQRLKFDLLAVRDHIYRKYKYEIKRGVRDVHELLVIVEDQIHTMDIRPVRGGASSHELSSFRRRVNHHITLATNSLELIKSMIAGIRNSFGDGFKQKHESRRRGSTPRHNERRNQYPSSFVLYCSEIFGEQIKSSRGVGPPTDSRRNRRSSDHRREFDHGEPGLLIRSMLVRNQGLREDRSVSPRGPSPPRRILTRRTEERSVSPSELSPPRKILTRGSEANEPHPSSYNQGLDIQEKPSEDIIKSDGMTLKELKHELQDIQQRQVYRSSGDTNTPTVKQKMPVAHVSAQRGEFGSEKGLLNGQHTKLSLPSTSKYQEFERTYFEGYDKATAQKSEEKLLVTSAPVTEAVCTIYKSSLPFATTAQVNTLNPWRLPQSSTRTVATATSKHQLYTDKQISFSVKPEQIVKTFSEYTSVIAGTSMTVFWISFVGDKRAFLCCVEGLYTVHLDTPQTVHQIFSPKFCRKLTYRENPPRSVLMSGSEEGLYTLNILDSSFLQSIAGCANTLHLNILYTPHFICSNFDMSSDGKLLVIATKNRVLVCDLQVANELPVIYTIFFPNNVQSLTYIDHNMILIHSSALFLLNTINGERKELMSFEECEEIMERGFTSDSSYVPDRQLRIKIHDSTLGEVIIWAGRIITLLVDKKRTVTIELDRFPLDVYRFLGLVVVVYKNHIDFLKLTEYTGDVIHNRYIHRECTCTIKNLIGSDCGQNGFYMGIGDGPVKTVIFFSAMDLITSLSLSNWLPTAVGDFSQLKGDQLK